MVDTVFIAILAIIVLIFSILVSLFTGRNFDGGNQKSNHFIDQPLNQTVKKSLMRYISTSLANIFSDNSQKKKFQSIFLKCISQTTDRKRNLTDLRKILRKSSLGSSNAGRDDKWRIEKRINS